MEYIDNLAKTKLYRPEIFIQSQKYVNQILKDS